MDISKLPVATKNKMWKRSMHAGSTLLHPDFGPPNYGIPFDVVDGSHADRPRRLRYDDESDPGPYPFGPDIHVEGGSDRHAIMIDQDTCTLYELYAAEWNGGEPTAGSGAIFHLEGPDANDLRPATLDVARTRRGCRSSRASCDGTRCNAGAIDHAIRFTVDCTSQHYVWPARHQAGSSDGRCPPMGARFRLKAGFDTSRYSADARVILTAMKHYGLIVADNGSDWYFQGEVDAHWTNDLMDELKSIPAGAFVAVTKAGAACRRTPRRSRTARSARAP